MKDYEPFSRTIQLIGLKKFEKLQSAQIAIVGIGGVGSFAFEAVVRSGVGNVHIIDYDVVEISNCNRQLLALSSTLGLLKVDVAEKRAKDISPNVTVYKYPLRMTIDNIATMIHKDMDFVIDAIDDVPAKIALIEFLYTHNIPFISCMGAARATNPLSLRIGDIHDTQYCPLARIVRKELKKRGIHRGVMCIYYSEHRKDNVEDNSSTANNVVPGSTSYMPGIMGLAAAGYAIEYIIQSK